MVPQGNLNTPIHHVSKICAQKASRSQLSNSSILPESPLKQFVRHQSYENQNDKILFIGRQQSIWFLQKSSQYRCVIGTHFRICPNTAHRKCSGFLITANNTIRKHNAYFCPFFIAHGNFSFKYFHPGYMQLTPFTFYLYILNQILLMP